MGASSSQPSAEEVADSALFEEAELNDLRACFDLLKTVPEGVVSASSFDGFPKVLPWDRLAAAMAEARSSGPEDVVARWPGFLALVTRCCKTSKRERLRALSLLYTDAGDVLSRASLARLVADALAAARLGDAVTAEEAEPLAAVAADVTLGSATVHVDSWLAWANEQLPAFALVQPTFLLQYLCAVGRAAARARQPGQAAVSVRGQALAAAAGDGALSAALRSAQEPLLLSSNGGVEAAGAPALLPAAAWLVGLALGPAVEAREWRCLYSSASHGLSMNRFAHHSTNYGGPTLLLASTARAELLGAYIDTPLKPSDKFAGGRECFLFRLAPTFHVFRPTTIATNFVLFRRAAPSCARRVPDAARRC